MQNNNGHDVVIEEEVDQVVIGEVGGDGEEGGDQEVVGRWASTGRTQPRAWSGTSSALSTRAR